MSKDAYFAELTRIVDGIEKAYCEDSCDLGIEEVVNAAVRDTQGMDGATKGKRNEAAGLSVVPLAYLGGRLNYYGLARLDYKQYPYQKRIAKVLLKFCNGASGVNSDAVKQVTDVVVVLKAIDSKSPKHKRSLGYRYLRAFVLLVIHGSYYNASVVASFVTSQMILQK